jgi:hypothetical protein
MKSTEEFLLEVGPLEHFFILRTPVTQPGLITWVDLDGQAYFLIVKDDRLDECLEFLESRGCPVVDDPHQVDTVARRLVAGLEP